MPDFPATDPLFLSTLSLRRATPRPSPSCHPVWDFYPRSPCGERLLAPAPVAILFGISIHALLAESDRERSARLLVQLLFLSTLSLRRATHESLHGRGLLPISIHALLTESDQRRQNSLNRSHNFYPRSPYGERPPSMIRQPTPTGFLSTLSLRRATARPRCYPVGGNISIHALLTESDALY